MKPQLSEQTAHRWRSILPHFGIGETFLTGNHGPCPVCGGKDRFRFDDKEGRGTFYCSGSCGAGDGPKLIMLKTGMRFADLADEIRRRLGETTEEAPRPGVDPQRHRQACRTLWQGSTPVFDDEAAHYLKGRGLAGPWPHALRFCAKASVTGHPTKAALPALVALVTAPDGANVNIHRTYLEQGRKAGMPAPRKMMPGSVPEGSAIRLGAHDGRLGIAEGIETALMVRQRFGITCWSAIDAEKLKRFAIPDDVKELHVFGDNDLNYVGQAAAFELGRRASLLPNGPDRVIVSIPPKPGTDWADDEADETTTQRAA
jgi:putative DNA primase/helicase